MEFHQSPWVGSKSADVEDPPPDSASELQASESRQKFTEKTSQEDMRVCRRSNNESTTRCEKRTWSQRQSEKILTNEVPGFVP